MKVYIAAPWVDKAMMEIYAQPLEAAGHVITHKWWDVEGAAEGDSPEVLAYHRKNAELDYQGVKDAKLLILVNSSKSEGKAVEQGIAISDRKPIIAIGKRGETSKNVFHYLPNYIWVDTLDKALDVIRVITWLTDGQR